MLNWLESRLRALHAGGDAAGDHGEEHGEAREGDPVSGSLEAPGDVLEVRAPLRVKRQG